MPELIMILPLLAVPAIGFVALQRMGAFVVAEEAALIRLRQRLGRERRATVGVRLSRRGVFRRLDEARDLERLLVIAGSDVTPGQWGLRITAAMLTALGAVVIVNALHFAATRDGLIPWSVGLLLVGTIPLLAFLRLRMRVVRNQEHMGRAFAELAALLAALGNRPPLRNPASVEPTDVVAMLASWIDDPALRAIVGDNRWRRLLPDGMALPVTESAWLVLIAELYGVPAAARVADVVRISREQNAGDVAKRYLLTARDLSRERLANLRARNRRAMITQLVPMIGLLASIMILVLSAVAAIHLGDA